MTELERGRSRIQTWVPSDRVQTPPRVQTDKTTSLLSSQREKWLSSQETGAPPQLSLQIPGVSAGCVPAWAWPGCLWSEPPVHHKDECWQGSCPAGQAIRVVIPTPATPRHGPDLPVCTGQSEGGEQGGPHPLNSLVNPCQLANSSPGDTISAFPSN